MDSADNQRPLAVSNSVVWVAPFFEQGILCMLLREDFAHRKKGATVFARVCGFLYKNSAVFSQALLPGENGANSCFLFYGFSMTERGL
ncbi:MAG: hypothetical protein RR576_07790 [Oscillospiraceae bacterium]